MNKACCTVPTAVVFTHIYGNHVDHVTTWTFVYKEVVICACAAAKRTRMSLTRILLFLDDLLMFNRAFGVILMY